MWRSHSVSDALDSTATIDGGIARAALAHRNSTNN